MNKQRKVLITITYNEMGIIIDTKAEEVAQPNLQPTCNQLATDTISRQTAIDALCAVCGKACDKSGFVYNAPQDEQVILCPEHYCLCTLPSAQPTLYGYSIENLALIAALLAKENLPPERVVEALSDIGRIIAIVRKESEEAMRKAVEQCMI